MSNDIELYPQGISSVITEEEKRQLTNIKLNLQLWYDEINITFFTKNHFLNTIKLLAVSLDVFPALIINDLIGEYLPNYLNVFIIHTKSNSIVVINKKYYEILSIKISDNRSVLRPYNDFNDIMNYIRNEIYPNFYNSCEYYCQIWMIIDEFDKEYTLESNFININDISYETINVNKLITLRDNIKQFKRFRLINKKNSYGMILRASLLINENYDTISKMLNCYNIDVNSFYNSFTQDKKNKLSNDIIKNQLEDFGNEIKNDGIKVIKKNLTTLKLMYLHYFNQNENEISKKIAKKLEASINTS